MTNYTGPEPIRVREMFQSIARNYDRANTVLSGGIHHLWKRRLVDASGVKRGDRVLDCATGTGDLAFLFAQAVGAAGSVIATDFCEAMLEVGRQKGVPSQVRFETADVTALPYADGSFDIASISFGIRNVGEPLRGLAEMARVVRSGGKVMVLEFGQPTAPVFDALYRWYSRWILPRLGGIVSGNPEAYRYLEQSASRFPCGEEFVELMSRTGNFASVEATALTGGVAYVYRGVRR